MLALLHTHLFLGLVGIALGGTALRPVEHRQLQSNSETANSAIESCLTLRNSCNADTVDLSNFYSHVPCIMLTACSVLDGKTPQQVLEMTGAPTSQARLTEETFYNMSGGNTYMSEQNYIDAYYGAISNTPNGTYPVNITDVISEWQAIAAWSGFCDTLNIAYSNFADWLEYSSTVCGASSSCSSNNTNDTCVPQPDTDNGSCAEIVKQCQLFFTPGALFENEYCVLASFCYAWSTTDVLLAKLNSSDAQPPTTSQQRRLSEDVFYNISECGETITQQNVIDAYYTALTGVWTSSNETSGGTAPVQTTNNGPYPTSPQYVIDFWAKISAWTGFCDSREIPQTNIADYLSYAAGSNYSPSC